MIEQETIEMKFEVSPKSGQWEPFQQLLIDQQWRLRRKLDVEINKRKYWEARFQYYATRSDLVTHCAYCKKGFINPLIEDHIKVCKDHPIHTERGRIHEHYRKQIMERDAKIKHQRMAIKDFEKKLKKRSKANEQQD